MAFGILHSAVLLTWSEVAFCPACPTGVDQRVGLPGASSFDQYGKPDRCYHALLAAEQAPPQEVRRSTVRTMASDLLHHDRTLTGVRGFAHHVGALT
ncbi:hypothetical protein GCM10009578_065500 [Streptomyces rhizosphaericus]